MLTGRTFGIMLSLALLAAFVVWVVMGSVSFHGCVSAHGYYAADQHQAAQTQAASVFRKLDGLPLYERCVWAFVVRFNPAITALSTVLLAFITLGLVWVAFEQFATTHAQLRAYVCAKPAYVVSFDENSPCQIRMMLRNDGPTPAFRVRHAMGMIVMAFDKGGTIPKPTTKYSAPLVLFPKDEFQATYTNDRNFSPEEIELIRAKTHALLVYGIIKYRDVFRRNHDTSFCIHVDGEGDTLKKLSTKYAESDLTISFTIAPVGNEAT